jgi:dienelactone hydrolase
MGTLVFFVALASGAIPVEDLPKGRVVERVVCAGDQSQSYALYLPAAYSPKRAWPILYCLDPGARGSVPVELFAEAAEQAGWIVAGSNNSRNGPLARSIEDIGWLVRDTHARFSIDGSRVYAAGMSGGARLALFWAGNSQLSGVIACAAGFSGGTIPKGISFRVFGTAGVDDFNFDEIYAMSIELSQRGVPQRFAEFPGGHDWLPKSLTGPAIDFLSGRLAAEPPPPASPVQKKVASRYASLTDQIGQSDGNGQRAILEKMHRDAQLPEDGLDRRVARRVLLGTFVGAIEHGGELLAQKKYVEAVQAWELALLAKPDDSPFSGETYYGLAAAQAGVRNTRRAVDALERAITNGFRDRDRIEHEPAFDRLRNDPKFAAAISALKK